MKFHLLLSLLLLAGCTTMPHTNKKTPETVTVVVQERPKDAMLKISIAQEAVKVLRVVGAAIFKAQAKEYEGSYSASVQAIDAVQLTPVRKLDKQIVLRRDYKTESAVMMSLDLVPIVVTNSQIGYFQVRPRLLEFNLAKAKMTGFLSSWLKADRINLEVKIAFGFANTLSPTGLTPCSYSFIVKNVQAGKTIPLTEFMSPIYEVGSDGPLFIEIQVKENNCMSGMLRTLANVVK